LDGVMTLSKSRLEPTRHTQRIVNQRFHRKRLWVSLALVGSNFLGNSWVDAEPQGLNPPQGAPHPGCSARSSGAALDRVVAIEMAADGDAQARTVRRPRCLWYQRIGRW